MHKIIVLTLVIFTLFSCSENKNGNPLDLKTDLSKVVATEDQPLYVDSLPNPFLLLDEALIKTKYPDYDESKSISKSDNVKGILAIRRKLNENNDEQIKFVRLSISKRNNLGRTLKSKIDDMKNYFLIDGLGFEAAWNPNLNNLNFLHKNYVFNLIIDDYSKNDSEKLEIAESYAKVIMQRIENF